MLLDESAWKVAWIHALFVAFEAVCPIIREDQIWQAVPRASRKCGNLVWNVCDRVAEDFGLRLDQTLLDAIKKGMENIDYVSLTTVRSGARQLVTSLAANYQLGFMANQNMLIREKLDRAGVLGSFANKKVSDDFNLEKPNLEYFRTVLSVSNALASKPSLSTIILSEACAPRNDSEWPRFGTTCRSQFRGSRCRRLRGRSAERDFRSGKAVDAVI